MSPFDIIRWAGMQGVDFNVRDGRLYVRKLEAIPPDLVAAIRAHKAAILRALAGWPTNATFQRAYLARCLPLAPDALTPAERIEAETLAADLAASGGLGQHVICLLGNWNDLSGRDRLAGLLAWQLAMVLKSLENAA